MFKDFKARAQRAAAIILIAHLLLAIGVSPATAYDTQEPSFQGVSVSTSSGSPGSTITITVSASDDVGLSGGVIGYESPTAGIIKYVFLSVDDSTGKLTGSYTVDRYDAPGTWRATYIEILDLSLNIFAATFDDVDLSAANLSISNSNPDITAPTFTSLSVSNTATNPGGKVRISIKASDAESGLAAAQVMWNKNWNSIVAFLELNTSTGQFEGDLYIPVDQPTGAYPLSNISIIDHQGNEFLWTSDDGSPILGKDLELSGDPKAPVAGFKDVHPSDWFAEELLFLVEYEILGGYSDGAFRPKNNVTRAEFAKMVCEASGWEATKPAVASFTDVPANHWAFGYIETAKEMGVIGGYPGGTFKPGANITRAEICKMLVMASSLELDVTGTNFGDVSSSHWAKSYILTARNYEFVGGYAGNLFQPGSLATRAEAAKMIYNSYDYLGM